MGVSVDLPAVGTSVSAPFTASSAQGQAASAPTEKRFDPERDLPASSAAIFRQAETAVLNGSTTLFLGAGFSRAATETDWKGLIEKLKQRLEADSQCPADWEKLTLLERAQRFQDIMGRCELEEQVIRAVTIKPGFPTPLEKAILSIPGKFIVTTNYDTLIEDTLDALGIPYRVIVDETDLAEALTSDVNNHRRYIFKMHGDVDSRNIVLTQSDYAAYDEQHHRMRIQVQAILMSTRPIVYGASLTDPNVNCLIECGSMKGEQASGFAFLVSPGAPVTEFADKFRLKIVNLNSFAALQASMQHLASSAQRQCDAQNKLPFNLAQREAQGDLEMSAVREVFDLAHGRLIEVVKRELELLAQSHTDGPAADQVKGKSIESLFHLAYSSHSSGYPVDPHIFLSLGQELLAAGSNARARVALEIVVPKFTPETPEGIQARRALGKAHICLGEPRNALRVLSDVLCLDKMNPSLAEEPRESLLLCKLYLNAVADLVGNMRLENRIGAAGTVSLIKLEAIAPLLPMLASYNTIDAQARVSLRETFRALDTICGYIVESRETVDAPFREDCLAVQRLVRHRLGLDLASKPDDRYLPFDFEVTRNAGRPDVAPNVSALLYEPSTGELAVRSALRAIAQLIN